MNHGRKARKNSGPSRRQVMIGAAGLTFGFVKPERWLPAARAAQSFARISPWVTIASNGMISIMSPATEMGQGSKTSLPLILAEELDADWKDVRIVPAPPNDALYGNPGFLGIDVYCGKYGGLRILRPASAIRCASSPRPSRQCRRKMERARR